MTVVITTYYQKSKFDKFTSGYLIDTIIKDNSTNVNDKHGIVTRIIGTGTVYSTEIDCIFFFPGDTSPTTITPTVIKNILNIPTQT